MDELDSDRSLRRCAAIDARRRSRALSHVRRRDDDVAALQIAVGDAVGCACATASANLAPHRTTRCIGNPACRDDFRQEAALDVFHRDEGLSIVRADFVDRADVRMVQLRRVLGFSAQPGVGVAITVGRNLQRDVAAELGVAGEIHLAHAASPQQPHDFVPADETLMDVQRFERWCLDEAAGLRVSGEEAIDVRSQPGRVRIAGARLVEKRIALGRISLERLMKHFFDARPSLGVH